MTHLLKTIVLALFASFFLLDLQTPLGVADGILYISAMPLLLFGTDKKFVTTVAAIALSLIIAGYFLSPVYNPTKRFDYAIVNRVFAIMGVTACSFMVIRNKQAQENLKKLNRDLEQKVIERTEKLATMLTREQELNKLKSVFVSTASHEFRTPLAAILSSTQLIDAYKGTVHQDKIANHTKKITSSVGNLINILDDFLSVGELEKGSKDVQTSFFDLSVFVGEIIDELSGVLSRKKQSIIYSHSGEKTIKQSQKYLRNTLINLISNASKFSNEGKQIIIITAVAEKTVTLKVQDFGIGIPPEDQSKLFRQFFRAGNTEGVQGTGLGLSIVKQYVELMKGEIRFESKVGEGTTFTIEIPQ